MTSKKNWTMRAAVLMFALVLITSCFVGGTFAKYVTKGEGSEKARVAKFGVEITATDGSMFKTAYAADDTTTAGTITQTVESSNDDKLVAPGTKEDNTSEFSVKGKPEVAVKVDMAMTVNKNVFLKTGSYKDYTQAPYTGNFALAADYYPVKFTLTKGGVAVVTNGKLEDVKTYLDGVSKEYAANTNLSDELGEFKLSWKWDFTDAANDYVDKADTLLGNLAADAAKYKTTGKYETGNFTDIADADFSTNIEFKLSITVTQID